VLVDNHLAIVDQPAVIVEKDDSKSFAVRAFINRFASGRHSTPRFRQQHLMTHHQQN